MVLNRHCSDFRKTIENLEMRIGRLRKGLSLLLVYSFSLLSFAADPPGTQGQGALLRTTGRVEINGLTGLPTKALLAGDLVETYDHSAAGITTAGASILVMPNSSVKFKHAAIELGHGHVIVATSNGMAATTDDLTITPSAPGQAKFEIAEDEDSVTIAALQGNLTVSDGQESWTVQEGQQTTRKKKKKKGGAVVAATGPALSRADLIFLLGVTGITTSAIVIAGQGSTNCVSPSGDKNCN